VSSRERAKGTAWESAVVQCLRAAGFVHAERRALAGGRDRGDVTGVPGLVVECKNGARLDLHTWLAEAKAEAANDGAQYGVAWAKRKGRPAAADGYVFMDGATFTALLAAAYGIHDQSEAAS
jgi:hypothetical protein